MRALDWLGRTALLVLSGLATFAILLSLQSASGALNDRAPHRATRPVSAPTSASDRTDRRREAAAGRIPRSEPTGEAIRAQAVPAPRQRRDDGTIVRWLRALTYAVLALAGFAAAAMLVLMRITAHLARIADR